MIKGGISNVEGKVRSKDLQEQILRGFDLLKEARSPPMGKKCGRGELGSS